MKVMIAYFSAGGGTEKMAEFIAEGVRFSGNTAVTRKISEIKTSEELDGYDGYIFGSPTYFQDVAGPMKAFLSLAEKANLKGKPGGAFASYTHDVAYQPSGNAADVILENMDNKFQMKIFDLGALKLREAVLETSDGMRACQDYGKVFGQKLGIEKHQEGNNLGRN